MESLLYARIEISLSLSLSLTHTLSLSPTLSVSLIVCLLLERCFAGGVVVAAAMDIATTKGVFPSKERQLAC